MVHEISYFLLKDDPLKIFQYCFEGSEGWNWYNSSTPDVNALNCIAVFKIKKVKDAGNVDSGVFYSYRDKRILPDDNSCINSIKQIYDLPF